MTNPADCVTSREQAEQCDRERAKRAEFDQRMRQAREQAGWTKHKPKAPIKRPQFVADIDFLIRDKEIEHLQRAVDEYDKALERLTSLEDFAPETEPQFEVDHRIAFASAERQRIAKLAKGGE